MQKHLSGESLMRRKELTSTKPQVAFQQFVQVLIQKSFGPEPLGLVVLYGIVGNAPMVVSHHSASGNMIAFKFVVFSRRMRDSCFGNARPMKCVNMQEGQRSEEQKLLVLRTSIAVTP